MLLPDDRHVDATRPEPPGGATREEWIKGRLKAVMRGPWQVSLTTRQEGATGPSLSSRFTDYLDVSFWLGYSTITDLQQQILYAVYGPADMTLGEAARALALSHRRIAALRHDALERLIRYYWSDATYTLPGRQTAQTHQREATAHWLRDLEWD